jgi:hypothetical protein
MSLALVIVLLVVQTALWVWLVVAVRPWLKKRLSRWLWRRIGGTGDPPP